jgi:hypothetical protein
MLAFIDTESRIPPDDPLRTIKYMADESLTDLSPLFDEMYAEIGRPSIRPERLLKASLLISLYSVRSDGVRKSRRAGCACGPAGRSGRSTDCPGRRFDAQSGPATAHPGRSDEPAHPRASTSSAADAMIGKPFDLDALDALVQRLLSGRTRQTG